jgi:hypothetical protein
MDIYALGQLMQWYVTGSTHQGTGRRKLASILPELGYLDGIVDRCLSFDPNDRFQSIADVRAAIKAAKQRAFSDVMEDFAAVCASTVPTGLNAVVHLTSPDQLDRLLNNLSNADRLNEREEIWAIRGHESFPMAIRQTKGVWLLGPYEIRLRDAWVYHDLSEYSDIICIRLEAMPPFGLYEREEGKAPTTEEAGLVDEATYVTRSEHDNGWAEIDGEAVSLAGGRSQLRCRHLTPRSYVLVTRYHCAFQRENENAVEAMMRRMDAGESPDSGELREWIGRMSEHKHRDVEMHL